MIGKLSHSIMISHVNYLFYFIAHISATDKHLHMMWRDSAWIPMLNTSNILEYFANSPFYDRECNNEMIKMQRLNPDQLLNMTGIEYFLLHTQAPILYVIRKGNRQSPTHSECCSNYSK